MPLKRLQYLAVLLISISQSTILFGANEPVLFNENMHEIYRLPWSGEVNENITFSADVFMVWYNNTYLNPALISWEKVKSDMDNIGMQHIRYQQYYQGTLVEHGTMILHLRNDRLVSFNGEIYPNFSAIMDSNVGIPLETYTAAHSGCIMDKQAEIVYMVGDDGVGYLCNVYLATTEKESILDKLFVASDNNHILSIEPQHIDIDAKGSTNTHFIGVQKIITDSLNPILFRLRENARPIRTYKGRIGVDFYDNDNYWNNNIELVAGDVHYSVQLLHDFMKTKFNWNGYANNNDSMISVVNWAGSGNAYWNSSGNYATFLVRSSATIGPCASIDVVGHEFGHGIANENAGLVYSGESCMLHESFGDINGTLLEWYHDSTKYNWLMGENVYAGGMRNMRNPNAMNQPDTYKGKWFIGTDCHRNSGVQNYWFYLMVKGDTATNDFGYKYKIEGMGFEKAMAILYRAVFYYWTAKTTYADTKTYAMLAAKDLFGNCSKEFKMTNDAFKAVGLEDTAFKVVDLSHSLIAPKIVCTSIPDTISLSSKGDIYRNVTWYFENGDLSNMLTTNFVAQKPGNYIIKLKTEICGNTMWDTSHMNISYQPIPIFNADKMRACNNGNDTVKITNNSINYDSTKIMKYEWMLWPFGRTDTTKHLNIPVQYTMDMNVLLKAYYQDGCWDTTSLNIVVNNVPNISFATKPSCENDNLKLTNTTDTIGKAMEFRWYLNKSFISDSFNPQIIAKTGGTFPVTLKVTDSATGCEAVKDSSVEINKNPIPTFKVINPCTNQDMVFINTTRHPTLPNYFRWHLPSFKPYNKDTVTVQNGADTQVPVALEYKDQHGCFAILYDTIVLESVKAEFFSIDSICAGSDVVLKSNTNPKSLSMKWFMDDIPIGTDTTITIKKIKSGSHAVRQELYGTKCTDISQKMIVVHASPEPNFTIKKDICDGDTGRVLNTTKAVDKTTYLWSWGDGKTNFGDTTSHVYHLQKRTETESFIISLTAKDSQGCSEVLTKSIIVNAPPNSDFNYKVNHLTVDFKSEEQDPNYIYNWQFGDGGKSSAINPTHTYAAHSRYDASLQVISRIGCVAQQSKKDIMANLSVMGIAKNCITLSPNPCSNQFTLSGFTSWESIEVHIYDFGGKEVFNQTSFPRDGKAPFSINLPSGVYSISVLGQQGNSVFRLMVVDVN